MNTSKPTTTSTSSNKKPETATNNQPRKLTSFLSSKRKSTTSDASTLGTAFNNMKLSQDTSKTTSKQDPSKDKKTTTSSIVKPPLKPLKEEKDTASIVGGSKDQKANEVIIKANNVTYCADSVVGNGSFGVVVRAIVSETQDVVAIKKVLQDKRYKNRELQIMQTLNHPNIVELKNSFFTNGDKPDEIFLHLVLEFVPDTVYRVSRHYSKLKQSIPMIYIKVYTYQLLRALGYIHAIGVCHRDIKPQNLLLDPQLSIMKICDFGSAKMLVKGEPNVAYICSRYYRAPELVFGATNYTTAIDVWSAGCVLAELLLGQPLFPGESGVDQLVEIIKVLGTPTREEIQAMNHTYTEYKFPQIKGSPWSKVFRMRPQEAIDLVSKLLVYTPTNRLKPFEALAHPFFDELRTPGLTLPNGKPLPALFNFSDIEIKECGSLLSKILPAKNGTSNEGPESSTTSSLNQ